MNDKSENQPRATEGLKEQVEHVQKLQFQVETINEKMGIPPMNYGSWAGDDVLDSVAEKKTLDYRPTRYELLQLVRHWAGVYIEEKRDSYGRLGIDPFRMSRACEGLMALQKVLGEAEVDKVVDEEIERARKIRGGDYEEWRLCFHGTAEEMAAFESGRGEPEDGE